MVSPMWRVVDLGTEFGMVAGKQNEVHVFRGQVQVERAGAAALTLAEGEALGTGVDGQLKAMRADRRDFDDLTGKRLHGTGGMTRISMTEFVLQTLVPDDEGRKAALRPRVEQFIAAKRAWLGDPMMPDEGVAKAQPELWAALMARDTPEDQLQQKLEALRIAKKSALVTVQEAEGALRGELTAREEAILVLAGWMN